MNLEWKYRKTNSSTQIGQCKVNLQSYCYKMIAISRSKGQNSQGKQLIPRINPSNPCEKSSPTDLFKSLKVLTALVEDSQVVGLVYKYQAS